MLGVASTAIVPDFVSAAAGLTIGSMPTKCVLG